MLARSARLAGKDDVAAAAESRAKEIDAKLDAEYHEKVPPFKPATFAGRKNAKGDRAVVMEIFTGAQCPPCVAADVGFDALLTTYKPTEFIGLQYHLHIPGPDPLDQPRRRRPPEVLRRRGPGHPLDLLQRQERRRRRRRAWRTPRASTTSSAS